MISTSYKASSNNTQQHACSDAILPTLTFSQRMHRWANWLSYSFALASFELRLESYWCLTLGSYIVHKVARMSDPTSLEKKQPL